MINNPLKCSWKNKNCIILPHISPDGDAIGSALAIYFYLKRQTDNVWIVNDDPIPNNLMFLNPQVISLEEYQKLELEADVVFCVDSSDRERFAERDILVEKSDLVINIDHHKTNTMYGDINIVEPFSSSAGELIFELLIEANQEVDIDMATALYVAISTDTGSFKYSNTSARTMEVAGELIKKNINLEEINIALYQDDPIDKYYSLQAAIDNALWEDDGKLVVTAVTLNDIDKYNMEEMETEGIVEFFRDIHGVEVVMLLKEKEKNVFKVSMRSKLKYDVSEIALQISGGGHMRAAGGTVRGNLEDCVKHLINLYGQYGHSSE